MQSERKLPQRLRLVGKLDGIEASTKRFSLVLDSGDKQLPGYARLAGLVIALPGATAGRQLRGFRN